MRTPRWLGPLLLAAAAQAGCKGCDESLSSTPGNLSGQFCDPDTGAGVGRIEVVLQKQVMLQIIQSIQLNRVMVVMVINGPEQVIIMVQVEVEAQ